MKKYSEIKLNENQKALLIIFRSNGYTKIGNDDMFGLMLSDGKYALSIDGLQDFKWIEENVYYEIDKLLNPTHEATRVWDLEDDEECWFLTDTGAVGNEKWGELTFRKRLLNQGNIFLTKEEAEFESKRREVVAKVRKYARPFIGEEKNYYAYYDLYDKKIKYSFTRHIHGFWSYFDSWDNIQKAIDEVGEEDFKRYYLGVVEDA